MPRKFHAGNVNSSGPEPTRLPTRHHQESPRDSFSEFEKAAYERDREAASSKAASLLDELQSYLPGDEHAVYARLRQRGHETFFEAYPEERVAAHLVDTLKDVIEDDQRLQAKHAEHADVAEDRGKGDEDHARRRAA